MQLLDLVLLPIYLVILYNLAYKLRKTSANKNTRKYFIPALTVKFIGALGVGLIYYFYYPGGDTTQYFKESRVLFEALITEPIIGIKMLFANGEFNSETYKYSSRIYWYTSPPEYLIIKLVAFFSVFGLGSYSNTALFFAFISFTGVWATYKTFLKIFPKLYYEFAISILFIPSVFFWGSGVMKDSVTLGALGWLFYGFYQLAIEKKNLLLSGIIILISSYLIYVVKVYILLAFLPPALLWIFNENNKRIKSKFIRNLLKPVFLVLGSAVGYIAATTLTAGSAQYDVSNIAERTKINSEYLSKQIASGSAYEIETFDGSLNSIIKVAPQAIVVAIFRPFIWEVRNPFMLLSALEALVMLYLTLKIFYNVGILKTFQLIGSEPIVLFCMIFSMVLAFAVGTNSGNFGTLVRYKIPLMPFYLSALFIMESKVREKFKLKKPAKSFKFKTVN